MDKAVLKKFAIESRQDLMQRMENKIKTFYIDEEFSKQQSGDVYILANSKHSLNLSREEYTKRELLIKRINELGLDQVIEEAAYTWFNRIVAIRYMEIHDYLPLTRDNQSLGIRVLSSKDNTPDPEIMKFTNLVNPELDINFKKEKYVELKDDNEKFKYILLLVCRKLGRVIPQVFDGITDYIDILVPDNLLNESGFVNKIITEVAEENYEQVEIIGWLYQYYNQTEKDRVISAKKAYKKNEIPYATQLFTPDWIVKYMVENTLGRYWIEHNVNKQKYDTSNNITNNWKYFINDNLNKVYEKIDPKEITFLDPCCGSGHVLVYAFDVLYQIYQISGFNKNDIPEMILKNNLYGLDIDDRAGQLSILSVILKARKYDKKLFSKSCIQDLMIMSIQENHNIENGLLDGIDIECKNEIIKLFDSFKNAKEIGSLLYIDDINYELIEKFLNNNENIFANVLKEKINPLIKVFKILNKKFDIIVTNPPYLSNSLMNESLKKYINKYYSNSKYDLCVCFIEKALNMVKKYGYTALVTMQSWMFLASFDKCRKNILTNYNINLLMHMDNNVMRIAFGTSATIFSKKIENNTNGLYFKVRYEDIENEIPKNFPEKIKDSIIENTQTFLQMPNNIIAYWLSNREKELFKKSEKLEKVLDIKQGLATGDNGKFVRNWFEVDFNKIGFNCNSSDSALKSSKKWFPYNKGGEYRKWYGNNDFIVNWEHDGYEIKNNFDEKGKLRSRPQNTDYYFKPGITWSLINKNNFGARYSSGGYLFDVGGSSAFCHKNLNLYLAYLCSNVALNFLRILNPTVNFQIGDIKKLPIVEFNENEKNEIEQLTFQLINIYKDDWDSHETSWDFRKNILLNGCTLIKDSILKVQLQSKYIREKIKQYETRINQIFIEAFQLNSIISDCCDEKSIKIRTINEKDLIKELISYGVGCMFGRYSLDNDGIICTNNCIEEKNYTKLKIDDDNIIPITDYNYFQDDIVEKFKKFLCVAFSSETLNINMDYIAEVLGKKGTETSSETLRRYFLEDFYSDHLKMYQKKPIYWLLDGGNNNSFKALIYIHRYDESLIPKVRINYLHRVQTTYEKLLSDVNYRLTTDLSMVNKKDAQKKQADLNAKLQEIKEYDEKIAHIANQRISIDLDDGVKVNYEKFKEILATIK